MIFNFDFRGINTSTEQGVFDGFLSNVLKGIGNFMKDYQSQFSKEQIKEILSQNEPNEAIKMLFLLILLENSDSFAAFRMTKV